MGGNKVAAGPREEGHTHRFVVVGSVVGLPLAQRARREGHRRGSSGRPLPHPRRGEGGQRTSSCRSKRLLTEGGCSALGIWAGLGKALSPFSNCRAKKSHIALFKMKQHKLFRKKCDVSRKVLINPGLGYS